MPTFWVMCEPAAVLKYPVGVVVSTAGLLWHHKVILHSSENCELSPWKLISFRNILHTQFDYPFQISTSSFVFPVSSSQTEPISSVFQIRFETSTIEFRRLRVNLSTPSKTLINSFYAWCYGLMNYWDNPHKLFHLLKSVSHNYMSQFY